MSIKATQRSNEQGIANISKYLENPNVSARDKVIVLTSSYAQRVGALPDPALGNSDDRPVMARWLINFINSTDNDSLEQYFSDRRVSADDKKRIFGLKHLDNFRNDPCGTDSPQKPINTTRETQWKNSIGPFLETVPLMKDIPASFFEMDIYQTSDQFVQAKAELIDTGTYRKERKVFYRDAVRVKEVETKLLGFVVETRQVIDSMDGSSHARKNKESGRLTLSNGKLTLTDDLDRAFNHLKPV
jgi:hypothetical protein